MSHILDCGDNSCYFKEGPKGGMRTNGGCRCLRSSVGQMEVRRRLKKMEGALREIERQGEWYSQKFQGPEHEWRHWAGPEIWQIVDDALHQHGASE